MKIIKLLLISAIVLFAVLTFVFSLFPSDISVSRVIEINADRAKTDSVINELNTWNAWNHFASDSLLTGKKMSVPSSGTGAYIQSDQFRVTITESNGDSVSTHWTKNAGRPFDGIFMVVSTGPGITAVQWYFRFHFRWYPWEKMGSMFYDKQLGPVMERSLVDLKNYVEKIP